MKIIRIAMAVTLAFSFLPVIVEAAEEELTSVQQACKKESRTIVSLYRSCLLRMKKQIENEERGRRRMDRKQQRIERIQKKSKQLILDSEATRSKWIQQNQQKSQDQIQYAKRAERLLPMRSSRRAKIQEIERTIQRKKRMAIEQNKEIQNACKRSTGAQRIMCLREKKREALEKDYKG